MSNRVKIQRKAVALRYDRDQDSAPRVVAKGREKVADKILDLARKHDVPIHCDHDLTELLSQLDLDEMIPREVYVIVAEILAFIYSISHLKHAPENK